MRLGFKITLLFLLFHVVCASVVKGEQRVDLERIKILTGGRSKEQNSVIDMKVFVSIERGGLLMPINTPYAFSDDKIFVESGANLRVTCGNQPAWLNYNTRMRIEEDGVSLERGEIFVEESGKWFGTDKLILQGASEYYVEVLPDGETTLYVIEGRVLAENRDTGLKRTISASPELMGIDESLEDKILSREKVERILMWRNELMLSPAFPAPVGRWFKDYWWAAAGATAAGIGLGILAKAYLFPSKVDVKVEFP